MCLTSTPGHLAVNSPRPPRRLEQLRVPGEKADNSSAQVGAVRSRVAVAHDLLKLNDRGRSPVGRGSLRCAQLGTRLVPGRYRNGGEGTPSCLQMPRPVGALISACRGMAARAPDAGLTHNVRRAPSRSGRQACSRRCLEVAPLQAATSIVSASAQPVSGIGSPRSRRSAITSWMASSTIARASSRSRP